MKAMTEYLAEHLPTIELLIEEFRLSIKDRSRELIDALQLYGMDSETVRKKLDMLGMDVGRLDETWEPSPQFYKLYRRLIRNRSTVGSVQTLARTGGQLEASYRTLDEMNYFSNLHVYRDYQMPHVFGKDGYFYMVYDPKYPISDNALVNNVLPAGYCFLCVTQFYGYDTGDVIPYDEIITNTPLYKDPFTEGMDNDRLYISFFTDCILDGHGYNLEEHRDQLLNDYLETVKDLPKTEVSDTWLEDIYSDCGLDESMNVCEDEHNRHGLSVEIAPWDNCIHEALTLSNVKGIMPQHDMGWSLGGLSVRDKTFGDLFRERDVRTQPKNASWVEMLNHAGTAKIGTEQHLDHVNFFDGTEKKHDLYVPDENGENVCLVITDSMQYHKDLIVSERQEFDLLYAPSVIDPFNETVYITIPTKPTKPDDVMDTGVFADGTTASANIIIRASSSTFVEEGEVEIPCDAIVALGTVEISIDDMREVGDNESNEG